MTVTTDRPAPLALRLKLDTGTSRKASLDGAWWPRSTDALAELPPLLEALGAQRGEITHVLLGDAEWDLPHPRRLTAGRGATRLGWYSAQPAGLLTVITEFGRDRFDLLVVPPGATPRTADVALSAAADAGDNRRTPELLEAIEHTG